MRVITFTLIDNSSAKGRQLVIHLVAFLMGYGWEESSGISSLIRIPFCFSFARGTTNVCQALSATTTTRVVGNYTNSITPQQRILQSIVRSECRSTSPLLKDEHQKLQHRAQSSQIPTADTKVPKREKERGRDSRKSERGRGREEKEKRREKRKRREQEKQGKQKSKKRGRSKRRGQEEEKKRRTRRKEDQRKKEEQRGRGNTGMNCQTQRAC